VRALLLDSLDEGAAFDPVDLALDLTPESVLSTLGAGDHLLALVMALRLNEKPLLERVFEAVPAPDVRLVARQLPPTHALQMLRFVAEHAERSPHVEFDLVWAAALLTSHGRLMRERKGEFAPVLRGLFRALSDWEGSVAKMCDENAFSLQYIIAQNRKAESEASAADMEMGNGVLY
jgi:periodic tryptophan protein 2